LTISFSGLPSVSSQADTPAVENTTLVRGESAAEQAASDAEALRSPAGFEAASEVIDTATQLVVPMQSVMDLAESLTGTLECLFQAMGYMDTIIHLVETFAEVRRHFLCPFSFSHLSSHQIHPISKVGIKALTTIYHVSNASQPSRGATSNLTCWRQLVKAQGDRDENIQALAAFMRDMLASLSEIQELEKKIKLLDSAIDLAMTRIDECAEFIIVYARHGFWGEPVRLAVAYVSYWNRNRPTDSPVANQPHCGYNSEIQRRFCSIEGEVQHRGRCSEPESCC
jgi:hypothetical protein